MSKLKNNVFFTIFGILTFSVVIFIVILNTQSYIEEKNSISNSLNVAVKNNRNIPPDMYDNNIENNIVFVDYTIYTVLLGNNNSVIGVINNSNNSLSDSEISNLAIEILSKKNIEREHIGFLYFDNYSYVYMENNSLVILDNSEVKDNLYSTLRNFIFIFICLEVIILFISKAVTNWITKPVEESFDKQKMFVEDASHELKTPLSVIVASAEALEASPKEKKWLTNIKNEAERMNELISDLLNLASSEREKYLEMEEVNLSKAVELSVLTFEGKAFENNIKLDYDIEDNIKFMMNENSIKELVEILLDNAIKHSKKNGTILIKLKEDNSNIKLLVINEGEGIPKGEEEKIFERFYRVDKSRNRKDNRYGLGLAIAKNIVIKHNGKISALSDKGITTFKVLFKK